MVASCEPPTGDPDATHACALTENRTGNPLVCRPTLNPLSHTSQGLGASLPGFHNLESIYHITLPVCFHVAHMSSSKIQTSVSSLPHYSYRVWHSLSFCSPRYVQCLSHSKLFSINGRQHISVLHSSEFYRLYK